jgi:tetratricopeptide (TPR) repeat protein
MSHGKNLWNPFIPFVLIGCLLCWLPGCAKNPAKLKAAALARAGEYDGAILEYKNALKADPNAADVYYQLGQAYLKTSQYREAFRQFERVVEVTPNHKAARLAIGGIYLKAGLFEDAQQIAKELLGLDPHDADAHLLLANAYAGKGLMSHAIAELEGLSREHPELAAVHINLGVFYAGTRNNELAEAELRRALTLEPDSFDARKALAALYLSTGRTGAAEELYRAAVRSNPKSAEVLMTLAQFYATQNRISDSEQLYKQVVALQNNKASARYALASFYVGQKRFEEARQVNESIFANDPDYMPARVQLVELALNAGDMKKAGALLTDLLKEQKHNPDVLVLQARLLLHEHKPQQAIQVLETSLKQGNSAVTHFLMGVAYSQTGDLQRAQGEMESAIAADTQLLDAYIGLAQMMLNRGEPKNALKYTRMALRRAPNSADCLLLAGVAYANMNDLSNAEKYFMAYASAKADSVDALVHMGSLRILQKRYPEAIAYFERALQRDPHSYEALDGVVSTLLARGDRAGALQRLRQALGKDDTPAMLNLAGKVYSEAGDFASAEEVLRKALQKAPDNFSTYALLGGVYAREKQVKQAISHWKSALNLHQNDAALWIMLGMLYQQDGDVSQAQAAYVRALDIEPNAGVAANNLAWIYADNLGDMDKALELARRAKIALPNVSNISDTLGWIYAKRHLNEMAVPLLAEAVKSEPKHAEYRFHLAVALLHSGKKNEARQEMASALKLNGDLRRRDEAREVLGTQ